MQADLLVCVTFDVDMVDSAGLFNGTSEVDFFLSELAPRLAGAGVTSGTLFLRMDDHVAAQLGAADAVFVRYAHELERFRDSGWQIGWHPHCYRESSDAVWVQNVDPGTTTREIRKHAPHARDLGLEVVRLGWGYQNNAIMQVLAESGFLIDSSAIPRPVYPWESSVKDWQGTPATPYRPSRSDYRIAGLPALDILEVPMTVGPVRAPYDQTEVLRYINLAYAPAPLKRAVQNVLADHAHIVTISHPHEFQPGPNHALLTFKPNAIETGVNALMEAAVEAGRSIRWIKLTDLLP